MSAVKGVPTIVGMSVAAPLPEIRRRNPALRILYYAVCVLLVPGRLYAADFAWGAGAGVAGLLGIVLLYRGLASGAMAVVAPITAVTSALVPMGVGLLVERLPSALALGGAVCAVAAIGLLAAACSREL